MNDLPLAMSLTGRHALVCGASQGIGRAAAHALSSLGARVTVLARRADALDEVVAELPGEARALVADLDDRPDLVAKLTALVADDPVHVLVHNTGGPPSGPLLDASEDAILHALSRHLLAAHAMVKVVVPGMAAAGYGRILGVLSTSVREPIDNLGVSNLTRAAVASWAKTLSRELPAGITINNILPGFTTTPRLASRADAAAARRGVTADDVRDGWRSAVAIGRLGEPHELGAAIAFLASPAASYICGVCLPVDGGRTRSI